MRDFKLLVPADCVVSNTEEENQHALKQMETVALPQKLFMSFSPGFSPVKADNDERTVLTVCAGKTVKTVSSCPAVDTGLKPGVNETRTFEAKLETVLKADTGNSSELDLQKISG